MVVAAVVAVALAVTVVVFVAVLVKVVVVVAIVVAVVLLLVVGVLFISPTKTPNTGSTKKTSYGVSCSRKRIKHLFTHCHGRSVNPVKKRFPVYKMQ